MLYVITGGSASGKSEYAERVALSIHKKTGSQGRLLYVATMLPYEDECQRRIIKHQRMRQGKGFTTIECYIGLEKVRVESDDVILIECMSNLLANEMFAEGGQTSVEEDKQKESVEANEMLIKKAILEPLGKMEQNAAGVVVVTNEVFSDGAEYENEIEEYCAFLGKINTELGKAAEGVVEVVYGIPLYQKGEPPC